jgi:hypothetical protein
VDVYRCLRCGYQRRTKATRRLRRCGGQRKPSIVRGPVGRGPTQQAV